MNRYSIHATFAETAQALSAVISEVNPTSVFLLTDANVEREVLPRLLPHLDCQDWKQVVIKAGEENKTLETVTYVWRRLTEAEATRRSMLINVGGGMVTDLGGFAASTFKRGIPFVNVATSLLGAVDASIGGKTGFDFMGFKNEIGTFAQPVVTLVATEAFATLPPQEILSGWGEVLKTAFLAGEPLLSDALREDAIDNPGRYVAPCLAYKKSIVEADPFEGSLRKVLNLGHTIGHALESLSLSRGSGVPHGIAVAHGLLAELVLSNMLVGLSSKWLYRLAEVIKERYPAIKIKCKDYPELFALMAHDKKNLRAGSPSFVLLEDAGKPLTDKRPSHADIESALDIWRDLTGQ